MITIDTQLTAVTVFPDRARLTRKGEIVVEQGLQQCEIAELPLQMSPDSVRVSAHGEAQAKLMGIQVQRRYYSETPAVQARELEERIEALQDEIHSSGVREELIKGYRARLDALGGHTDIYATALAAGETNVEAQLAMFDSLRKRAEKFDEELQALVVLKRDQERTLQKLKKQLDELRSTRPRERFAAIVEVEVLKSGNLVVELTYVVNNTSWKPLYDLRLREEEGGYSLEIGYLAQVMQQSGENWDNVSLSLSTARPALAAILPELDPWYIYPRPTVVRKASFALDAATPAAMDLTPAQMPMSIGMQKAVPVTGIEEAVATVDSSGAAVTYHIPGTVSAPADGTPRKVTVAHYALKPTIDYISAPKVADAAYRRAKVINDSHYTLLPGEANLFSGEEYIGATHLDLTAPQGSIELYLGVDDRIKIKRELARREVDKSLLIGGKRRTRYGYEISLENLLPHEIEITVQDHLPVSRHEDIKVRFESGEPKATRQSELNLLEWELTLAQKQKTAIRYDFSVEHPQTMDVVGLP